MCPGPGPPPGAQRRSRGPEGFRGEPVPQSPALRRGGTRRRARRSPARRERRGRQRAALPAHQPLRRLQRPAERPRRAPFQVPGPVDRPARRLEQSPLGLRRGPGRDDLRLAHALARGGAARERGHGRGAPGARREPLLEGRRPPNARGRSEPPPVGGLLPVRGDARRGERRERRDGGGGRALVAAGRRRDSARLVRRAPRPQRKDPRRPRGRTLALADHRAQARGRHGQGRHDHRAGEPAGREAALQRGARLLQRHLRLRPKRRQRRPRLPQGPRGGVAHGQRAVERLGERVAPERAVRAPPARRRPGARPREARLFAGARRGRRAVSSVAKRRRVRLKDGTLRRDVLARREGPQPDGRGEGNGRRRHAVRQHQERSQGRALVHLARGRALAPQRGRRSDALPFRLDGRRASRRAVAGDNWGWPPCPVDLPRWGSRAGRRRAEAHRPRARRRPDLRGVGSARDRARRPAPDVSGGAAAHRSSTTASCPATRRRASPSAS